MPQAKTLTPKELRRVLDSIANNPHSARNRHMLLMAHWAGMRVGRAQSLICVLIVDIIGLGPREGSVRAPHILEELRRQNRYQIAQ